MSQKKQRRKDNMFRFLFSRDPTLFSAAWLPSGPSRATLDTPDKSRKEISRHKGSLCNAVKLHWFSFFLFFCVYLTDNIKLLLCVMPRRALEITSASPSPLSYWVKMLDEVACRDLSNLLVLIFPFSAEESKSPNRKLDLCPTFLSVLISFLIYVLMRKQSQLNPTVVSIKKSVLKSFSSSCPIFKL